MTVRSDRKKLRRAARSSKSERDSLLVSDNETEVHVTINTQNLPIDAEGEHRLDGKRKKKSSSGNTINTNSTEKLHKNFNNAVIVGRAFSSAALNHPFSSPGTPHTDRGTEGRLASNTSKDRKKKKKTSDTDSGNISNDENEDGQNLDFLYYTSNNTNDRNDNNNNDNIADSDDQVEVSIPINDNIDSDTDNAINNPNITSGRGPCDDIFGCGCQNFNQIDNDPATRCSGVCGIFCFRLRLGWLLCFCVLAFCYACWCSKLGHQVRLSVLQHFPPQVKDGIDQICPACYRA